MSDYEQLSRGASNLVKKVKCLAPRRKLTKVGQAGDVWNYGNLCREDGRVNVIIIQDVPDDEQATPYPPAELVIDVGAPRLKRIIGTKLVVTGPRYLPIKIIANIWLWPSAIEKPDLGSKEPAKQELQARIEKRIRRYLHPIKGGKDNNGWEIGQDLVLSGLFDVFNRSWRSRLYRHARCRDRFDGSLSAVQPAGRPAQGKSEVLDSDSTRRLRDRLLQQVPRRLRGFSEMSEMNKTASEYLEYLPFLLRPGSKTEAHRKTGHPAADAFGLPENPLGRG